MIFFLTVTEMNSKRNRLIEQVCFQNLPNYKLSVGIREANYELNTSGRPYHDLNLDYNWDITSFSVNS